MTHDPGCHAYLFVNGGHLRHAGVELAGRLESQRFPWALPFLVPFRKDAGEPTRWSSRFSSGCP